MAPKRTVAPVFMAAALVLGVFLWSGRAGAAPPRVMDASHQGGERSLDFESAVGLAIQQSPYFTKSALEIEAKHLDESDSRWSFLPSVTLKTRYYVNRPDVNGLSAKSYAVDFLAEDYNPVEAFYSLKVRKLFTRIAVLGHLQVISQGLHRLARSFLQLDNLDRLAAIQEDMVKVAEKNLASARELMKLEQGALLEVKVAGQELEMAQLEKKRLQEAKADLIQALKAFLGIKADQRLTLDLKPVRQQILGDFQAAAASLEKARSQSFDLKIQNLKKELQALNITLAKTRFLPTLFFGVQTPDPLSLVDDHGYFFSVGLKLPVWDGFRRVRNISRQKTVLQQYRADEELKEIDVAEAWREARDHLRQAEANLKLSQGQEELARLKARQSEIRYQAGEPLGLWLGGRKAHLEARRQTALKALDYDLSALALRHLSGDLVSRYLDESSIRNK